MISRHIGLRHDVIKPRVQNARRLFSKAQLRQISQVGELPNWDLKQFQEKAFRSQNPIKLLFSKSTLPAACQKWFIHGHSPAEDVDLEHNRPLSSELRTAFWSDHESTIVPLELTATKTAPPPHSSFRLATDSQFMRTSAPLKILLTYLSNPVPPPNTTTAEQPEPHHSIYLAQCDLTSLPKSLQDDLSTPDLVVSSGKGDIYASSLWMGRPPTHTPLHRDPNPNLFLQLAGQKIVRLFPPEIGDGIFDEVQEKIGATGGSARFRGEEMMVGQESSLLHQITWEDDSGGRGHDWQAYASEARLGLGEALFIPQGWWHSVKGVGEGVTASANWWFR